MREVPLDSGPSHGTHSKAEVPDMAQDGVVRAAGGVVSRRGERGEVWEETSLRCALGSELPVVSYRDARGRAKTVRYWTMKGDGDAEARNEIDAVRWLGIPAAANLLSHLGDRELLAAFAAR